MTRLVALETSTWWGGVALLERSDDASVVVAEAGLRAGSSHAFHLLALLGYLMSESGWAKTSVDAYAATRGPGSFTGLRVGLGTIRGLALGAGRPSIGVGTLDAMAEALGAVEGDRVPLLDAGRGEVYGARFDPEGSPPVVLTEPWLGPPELALGGGSTGLVLFGPGAQAHRERLVAAGWAGVLRSSPTSVAAAAGRLALEELTAGATSGAGMSPVYLRPPDAELTRRQS
jgi:tRNA threonylcarbamoyladenosine biosynthesis protein TsaB